MCVELPLEFFSESNKLPIEAEPALEADEAKLSAPHGSDAAILASNAQANRDAKEIMCLVWHGRMAADEMYPRFERDGFRYEPVARLAPGSTLDMAGKVMTALAEVVESDGAEAVLLEDYGMGVIFARRPAG